MHSQTFRFRPVRPQSGRRSRVPCTCVSAFSLVALRRIQDRIPLQNQLSLELERHTLYEKE